MDKIVKTKNKKRMSKKRKLTLGIIGFLAVVCLCIVGFVFAKGLNNNNVGLQNESEESTAPEPVKKLQVVDLDSTSRPYAVMINNNSAVWKYQSGLNEAYIVYEALVEGGITREMALYKDATTEKIASVRSSRHYYLDYAMENDALYAHWGWSEQAQSDIRTLGINNINGLTYEGTYFFRDRSLKISTEHTGYTTMEALKKAAERLKYRTTTDKGVLLSYSVDPLDLSIDPDVQDANYVTIKFSGGYTAKFTYDVENKVYVRKQNNTDMVDYTSKAKITAKNIITYKVGYSGIPGDTKGRQNMSNIGSGDGYYITEGKAIPITWSKSTRSGKTVYKDKAGTELVVNDGNTYIELQPKNQTLTISAEIPA